MNNETLNLENLNSTIIKFALIGGIIHIAFCLLFYITKTQFVIWKDVPFLLLNIIVVILFIKTISNQIEYKTFGFLFKSGFTLSLFLSLIALVFVVIYLNLIDPNYSNNALNAARDTLVQVGMSPENIEAAMEKQSIQSPILLFMTAFFTKLICCTVVSAIGGAIFKKEK